jgi:hypothetical protein
MTACRNLDVKVKISVWEYLVGRHGHELDRNLLIHAYIRFMAEWKPGMDGQSLADRICGEVAAVCESQDTDGRDVF